MTRHQRLAAAALVLAALVAPALAYDTGAAVKDFTGTDSDGKPHTLSKQRGKVVVLVTWASQCMASKRFAPHLKQVAKANPNVVFWGLAANAGETDASIAQGKAAMGISFPVIRDVGGPIAKSLGAFATPAAYVIDASGKLRYQGALKKGKSDYLSAAITAAEAGRSPADPKTQVMGSRIKY